MKISNYQYINRESVEYFRHKVFRLLKVIRLIYTFYKSFFFFSFTLTLCCLRVFWQFGFQSFMTIFWFKILTLTLTYYFVSTYKNKEFYYFQNLGVSKLVLWITTLIFDFTLFIFLLIQIYYLK